MNMPGLKTGPVRGGLYLLAFFIILAGGYRLAEALVAVPGNNIVNKLRAGETLGEADWQKLEASYAGAAALATAPEYWNAVGRARSELQERAAEGGAPPPEALSPSLAAYGHALEASPVNGRA